MIYLTRKRKGEYRADIPCNKGEIKKCTSDYTHVEVDVSYVLGGPNYFSGGYSKRGYRVTTMPVSLGGGMRSFSIMGETRNCGGYILLEEATRYNDKRMDEIAEIMDSLVPAIAEAFKNDDTSKMIELCKIIPHKEVVTTPVNTAPKFQKSQMKILTEEIKATLPPLYSQSEKDPKDVKVVIKFFDPVGSWTWFVTEGEKTGEIIKEGAFAGEEDYKFFGYVKGFENELGYFTLGELSTAKALVSGIKALPIERDRHFKGTLAKVMGKEVNEIGSGKRT